MLLPECGSAVTSPVGCRECPPSGVALLRPRVGRDPREQSGGADERTGRRRLEISGPRRIPERADIGKKNWKEEREQVARRNDAAQKAGKLERDEYTRERTAARHAEEARRQASLLGRRRTP